MKVIIYFTKKGHLTASEQMSPVCLTEKLLFFLPLTAIVSSGRSVSKTRHCFAVRVEIPAPLLTLGYIMTVLL